MLTEYKVTVTSPISGSLADWLTYIEVLHPKQIEMGLGRMQSVYDRLGMHINCPVITVGGTNGKGSVCTMLESILRQAGYRVGLYTSPHIHQFNERARLNGKTASDEQIVRHFVAVEVARGETSLTYFEFSTLVIMRLFAEANLDVVILEVGLGGRLDAVNILDADVAVVTNVAIDHIDYLGDDREVIGYEKACIFRSGHSAICGDAHVPESLVRHAQNIGADLWMSERDFRVELHAQTWNYVGRKVCWPGLQPPGMQGTNQIYNAAIALAALEALSLPVSVQAIHAGLSKAFLPGRFQVQAGRPVVIWDVAHNPHAAAVLAANLEEMKGYAKTYAVFGAMQDKDLEGIIAQMKACVDVWCLTDLPIERAVSAHKISETLRKAGVGVQQDGKVIKTFSDPKQAFAYAAEQAGEDGRIVAFGSFWVVAGVTAATVEKSRH